MVNTRRSKPPHGHTPTATPSKVLTARGSSVPNTPSPLRNLSSCSSDAARTSVRSGTLADVPELSEGGTDIGDSISESVARTPEPDSTADTSDRKPKSPIVVSDSDRETSLPPGDTAAESLKGSSSPTALPPGFKRRPKPKHLKPEQQLSPPMRSAPTSTSPAPPDPDPDSAEQFTLARELANVSTEIHALRDRSVTIVNEPTECISPYLVSSTGGTGNRLVDKALERLQLNTVAVWIGNNDYIREHCEWRTNTLTGCRGLHWRRDSPQRPPGDPDDLVMVGYIGEITVEGSNMGPDANWNTAFNSRDIPKHKRTVAVTAPSEESRIPTNIWLTEMAGAEDIITEGRRSFSGELFNLGHCFMNKESNTLRARCPMFLPCPEGEEENMEKHTAPGYRYITWSIPQATRAEFDTVIKNGNEPQVLEAYTASNRLMHPNDVQKNLSGAIVAVFCTLEKSMFTGRNQPGGRAMQFYANLLKVQVLKRPPPFRAITKKRRLASAVGPNDDHGPSSGRQRSVATALAT